MTDGKTNRHAIPILLPRPLMHDVVIESFNLISPWNLDQINEFDRKQYYMTPIRCGDTQLFPDIIANNICIGNITQ